MFEFWNYVVKIEDEQEFDRRIKDGAEKNQYILCGRDIVYYLDKSIKDEIKVMAKRISNMNQLAKALLPVMVKMVDELAERVYQTLNYFL